MTSTGIRGFFLGLLAILIILALVLLLAWSALLDASTRDTIGGWFDFIG